MSDAAEEIQALRAALAAAEARATAAEAQALEAARDRAVLSGAEALIAALRLEIEKLKRALYGARSERKARLLDQLELQLEEFEAAATEDELAAQAPARPNAPASLVRVRRHTGRKPFPAHLSRQRVVIAAPCQCEACGSGRIVKLGEDITETLEIIPASGR